MAIVIQDLREVLLVRNLQGGHRQVVHTREVRAAVAQTAHLAAQQKAVHLIRTQHLQEAALPSRSHHQEAVRAPIQVEDLPPEAVAEVAVEVAVVADQVADANRKRFPEIISIKIKKNH